MHKKQKLSLGIGALGAATVLLSGCGGSSFQKNTFGNYTNTLPAVFGLEPTAASSNLQQNPSFTETSGLGSADGQKAFLTAASDFSALAAPDGSALNVNADPNATGKVPLGFATGGTFISGTAAPTAVQTGTPVVFRAAIANGVSSNSTPAITTVNLSSADPEAAALGTLPMTFNDPKGGVLANGTYVTGTNGTPTPFTLPFQTSGIHTLITTVSDDAGRQTATTFAVPVVTPANVALFLQNVIADGQTGTAKPTAIAAGDTVTIDGGAGLGVYPATGYNAATGKPSSPMTADPQGTVIFFVAPGTHTIVDTNVTPATAKAAAVTTVTTQTLIVAATAAGTTIIQ
jgi:hypothetical protein